MFACDKLALAATRGGLAKGSDSSHVRDERVFLYMPLQHSEDLADQEFCVALFAALSDGLCAERLKRAGDNLVYAARHRDIIKRFGRFPHCNALLRRTSTTEEAEFLSEPGSSF